MAREQADGGDVMLTFKALGALLSYPSEELVAALPEIRQALAAEQLLKPDARLAVEMLIDRLEAIDILELQEIYVGLFDRTRGLSLHLYEHVWGDARERGQAMVRLQTLYKLHGFSHAESELPDYLPLFCEFLSLIPEKAARAFLSDAAPVVDLLRERLAKRQSPYAGVAAALVSLASKLNPAIIEQLSKGTLPDDGDSFEALDRAWEEEPVRFGPSDTDPICSSAAASAPARV
jgi:nitrate reductase delta subunit